MLAQLLVWPPSIIPVEIFNIIGDYLLRSDIQNMRLVCSEFDSKLASYYFKNVVVPFRAELYGLLDPECQVVFGSNDAPKTAGMTSTSIFKNASRVFESFGPHIRSFALSLELDEADLESPPIKITQDVIAAPWGLYRWPCKNYQRFSDLEGIETVADETQHMKRAFKKLTGLKELGLSCDAGQGYLQGPDRNPILGSKQPAVFRHSRYGPDDPAKRQKDKLEGEQEYSARYLHLKKMVMKAGYSEEEAPAAIALLLECEGKSLDWLDARDDDSNTARSARRIPPLLDFSIPIALIPHYEARDGVDVDDEGVVGDSPENGGEASPQKSTKKKRAKLTPKVLTESQKEMLLEMRWAHEALLQSFAIAVIDDRTVFSNITKLTVARVPSGQIHILSRPEFWKSLSALGEVSLAVIPDWRSVTKSGALAAIEDNTVSPMDAYDPVVNLLQICIGMMPNIKVLHFEWICGGEFALGMSQRDRYILPAPIVVLVDQMVCPIVDDHSVNFVTLPHVERISLKNCWATPHILLSFIQHLTSASLTSLELESVSISGCPSEHDLHLFHVGVETTRHWPWPLSAGASPAHAFEPRRPNPQLLNAQPPNPAGLGGFFANPAFLPFDLGQDQGINQLIHGGEAPNSSVSNATLQLLEAIDDHTRMPRPFSWTHVINELSPRLPTPDSTNDHMDDHDIARFRALKVLMRKYIRKKKPTKPLKSIVFKSCGYVLVDETKVCNWDVVQHHAFVVPQKPDMPAALRDLDKDMLMHSSPLQAKIINYMRQGEQFLLETYFGMHFGWEGIYEPIIREAAIADGNPIPGEGRFSGSLSHQGDDFTIAGLNGLAILIENAP